MRFSDMMGSGPEKTSKPKPSEPDGVIANALAPYVDASPPAPTATPAPPAAPASPVADAVAPVAPRAPSQPTAPTEPTLPLVGAMHPATVPAASVTYDAPVEHTAVADLTPLSDDLLPRRR
jgi:hypothetical protein